MMQKIRQLGLPLFEPRLHLRERLLGARKIAGERVPFADERRNILTATFCHSHGFGVRVTLGAQAVHLDLPMLALVFELLELSDIQHESTPCEVARNAWQIGAEQFWIDQGALTQDVGGLLRKRASASPILISSPRGTGR